jgi:hypothetical protein
MVVRATAEEIEAHEARLQKISEKAPLLWPAKT